MTLQSYILSSENIYFLSIPKEKTLEFGLVVLFSCCVTQASLYYVKKN